MTLSPQDELELLQLEEEEYQYQQQQRTPTYQSAQPNAQFTPDSAPQKPSLLRELGKSTESFAAHAANTATLGYLPKIVGKAAEKSAILQVLNPNETPEARSQRYKSDTEKLLETSKEEYPVPAFVGDFYGMTQGASGAVWRSAGKAAAKIATSAGGRLVVAGALGGAASGALQNASQDQSAVGGALTGGAVGGATGGLGALGIYGMAGAAKLSKAALQRVALMGQKLVGNPELKAILQQPEKLAEVTDLGGPTAAMNKAKGAITDTVQKIQETWKNVYGGAAQQIDEALGSYGQRLDEQLSQVTQEMLQATELQRGQAQKAMRIATAKLVDTVGAAKKAPNLFWGAQIQPKLDALADKSVNIKPVMDDLGEGFSKLGWIEARQAGNKIKWGIPQTLDPRFRPNAIEIAKLLNLEEYVVPFKRVHSIIREVGNFTKFGEADAASFPMNRAWEKLRGLITQVSPEVDKLIAQYAESRKLIDPVASALFVDTAQGSNQQRATTWLKAVAQDSLDDRASKLIKFSQYSKDTANAVKEGLQAASKELEMRNIKPPQFGGLRKQMISALEKTDPNSQVSFDKLMRVYGLYDDAAHADQLLAQRAQVPSFIKNALLEERAMGELESFINKEMPTLKPQLGKLKLSAQQLKLHTDNLGKTRQEINQMVQEGLAQEDASAVGFVLDTVPGMRKLWNSAVFAQAVKQAQKSMPASGFAGYGLVASGAGAATYKATGNKEAAFGAGLAAIVFMRAMNNPIKTAELLYRSKAVTSLQEATKRAEFIQKTWPTIQAMISKKRAQQ